MIEVLSENIIEYINKTYLDFPNGEAMFVNDYNSKLIFNNNELISIDWESKEIKNYFYDSYIKHNESYKYNQMNIPEVERKTLKPIDIYNVKVKKYDNQSVFSIYTKSIREREELENIMIQIKRYRSQNSMLVYDLEDGMGWYMCNYDFLDAEIKMQLFDNDFDDCYNFVSTQIKYLYKSNIKTDMEKEERSTKTSLSRTKQKVYDLAYANTWDMFITLTYDDTQLIKRYGDYAWNYDVCVKALHSFFSVLKRNYPQVSYLGVPELHHSFYNTKTGNVVVYDGKEFKDKHYDILLNKQNRTQIEQELIDRVLDGTYKRRFHFHFLFNNFPTNKLIDSGKKDKKGKTIYNLLNYKLGFTTCTLIESLQASQHYITKYISKDLISVSKGKKRYWASKNLNKPIEEKFELELEEQRELKTNLFETIENEKRIKEVRVKNDNFENVINNYVVLGEEYNKELFDLLYEKVVLQGYDNYANEKVLTFIFNEMVAPFHKDTYFECGKQNFFYNIKTGVVNKVYTRLDLEVMKNLSKIQNSSYLIKCPF